MSNCEGGCLNPVRMRAIERLDDVRRNLFCLHYSDCLDKAIQKNWPGFSCEECTAYEEDLSS